MRTSSITGRFVASLICRRTAAPATSTGGMAVFTIGHRRKLIHSGLAVACVASLQLAGCVRGSRNEIAKDLREDAKKAAIQAQQEIAAKKHDAAIAESTAQKAPRADDASGSGMAARPRSNPLAEYLKRGRSEANSQDPFLVQQASASAPHAQTLQSRTTTVSQADAEWEALLEQKLAMARSRRHETATPSPAARPHRPTTSEHSLASAGVVRQQGPKARPFPSAGSARNHPLQQPAPAGASASPAVAQPAPSVDAAEATLQEDLLAATPNWLQHSPTETEQANGSGERAATSNASTAGAGPSAALPRVQPRGSEAAAVATVHTPPSTTAAQTQPELDARRARVRVDVLLDLAHAQYDRGDLHAAYRNALHAHQVAKKENVAFAAGEELPGDFAESIAQKLWGSPLGGGTTAASPTAGSSDRTSPESSTPSLGPAGETGGKAARGEQFAAAFGAQENSVGWSSAEDRTSSKVGPAGAVVRLPDSHPAGQDEGARGEAPNRPGQAGLPEWATPGGNGLTADAAESRDRHTATAGWETKSGTSRSESVEWARVERVAAGRSRDVATDHPSQTKDPQQDVTVPAPPASELSNPFAAVAAVELPAPFPPVSAPVNSGAADARAPSIEGDRGSDAAASDAAPGSGRGLLWGIIGFVAAAVSTVIGLRIQRSKEMEASETPDEAAATLPLTRTEPDVSGPKDTSRAA